MRKDLADLRVIQMMVITALAGATVACDSGGNASPDACEGADCGDPDGGGETGAPDGDGDSDGDVDGDVDGDSDGDMDGDIDGAPDGAPDGGADSGDDSGPAPSTLPPEDLGDCEVDEALALVNDSETSVGDLMGLGLEETLARAISRHRKGPDAIDGTSDDDPFDDALELAEQGMDEASWRALAGAASEGCPLVDGEPVFVIRFTDPQCDALPAYDIPEGVRCYGTADEREASREVAGVVDHVLKWIEATRRVKLAHPERDVRIVMAYLVWSDYRIYDALCEATAAGVRLEAFFDASTPGDEPTTFEADSDCNLDNVSINYLGGVTDYPDWRLMHIKLMHFDTGEATTRLLFSSANMTATGTTIHFENWVFARFPSDSHFVAAHHCARDALMADRYDPDGNYPALFRETHDTCMEGITATEDPRFQVMFTPDDEGLALASLVSDIDGATTSVELAIQHFSNYDLGGALASAGDRAGVTARAVLDDDTYYDTGDSGGVDHIMYDALLADSAVDVHFIQTNYFLEYGWQFQHNKYVILDGSAVFCGAGNFTSAAFHNNYENFYRLEAPEIASAFTAHFDELFGLAKPAADLPVDPEF